MRLGFHAKFETKDRLEVCLDDDALSDRHWIIGTVAITVRAGSHYDRFMDGSEPTIAITGNPEGWRAAGDVQCNAAEFEHALREAKEYAATMHAAIHRHLRRLTEEHIKKNTAWTFI